ncbi:MAG: family 16 glycosylhydrolase [Bacteroidales bacterium]|nr:family 16 glycosylhydrolase [Bacteroidales bacterium]
MSAKFLLYSKLGLIPKTSVLEEKEYNLKQKFEDFNAYKESEEYARYEELNKFITSSEFEEKKKEINSIKYSGSEAYNKEKKYKELSKSKQIKTYYKVKDSTELESYNSFLNSEKLADYERLHSFFTSDEFDKFKTNLITEKKQKINDLNNQLSKYSELKNADQKESEEFLKLQELVNSGELKKQLAEAKKFDFKDTDKFKELQTYKALKKSSEIKQHLKFANSAKFAIYNNLENSDELKEFIELEAYIKSDEFKNEKEYLLTKDKFKLSEEFKQQEEYKTIIKSEKFNWFEKLQKKNDFDKLHIWKLSFEDNFDNNKLDQNKWTTGYYWGKELLKDHYVLLNEKQFFTDKNIKIENNNLVINTTTENVTGKVWDHKLGFYEREFDYTSGLINTGNSFRQKFGLFQAKIKVNHSYPIHHAFWLLGEKITPEINIFKYGEKSASKLEIANFWSNDEKIKSNKKRLGGLDFSKDYFIYSLEWTSEKLIWRINDIVIYEQTQGVPQEEMYIVLSSGIHKDGNVNDSNMEVDWVRAFTPNN